MRKPPISKIIITPPGDTGTTQKEGNGESNENSSLLCVITGNNFVLFRSCFQVKDSPTFRLHVFELGDLYLFGSTQFFTPYGGFLLITLLLGMLHCFFFQDSKGYRFLDVCAKVFAE